VVFFFSGLSGMASRVETRAAKAGKRLPQKIVKVRERRPQQRSIATREKVIEVAAVEFAEHGFKAASTRSVAAAAGIQHTLITYHFGDKEGLWRAVLISLYERFDEMYLSRLQGLRGVDASTKLRLILEEFVRFSAQNPNFHWLMAHEASKGGRRLEWLVDKYVKKFFTSVTDLIRAAQEQGRFVTGDPYHLMYVVIGAVTHVFMLAAEVKNISGKGPTTPAYVEEHVRICLGLFFLDPAVANSRPDAA
jgi:TetR/AcrR family transcriptional regulator